MQVDLVNDGYQWYAFVFDRGEMIAFATSSDVWVTDPITGMGESPILQPLKQFGFISTQVLVRRRLTDTGAVATRRDYDSDPDRFRLGSRLTAPGDQRSACTRRSPESSRAGAQRC